MSSAPLVKHLYRQIGTLRKQIHFIQDNCKHNTVHYKYGSNTGNYDPSSDCYWVDVTCDLCGKTYSIDSDKPEYRTFKEGRLATEVK